MRTATREPQLVRCPSCGSTNRVPIDVGKKIVCGRCKTELSAGARPFEVTDATFVDEVGRSTLPVLLDMWAEWCGPCRMLTPVIDQLAMELAGRVRVARLNIDENPHTTRVFGVRSIPTLLIVKNGREVDRIVGVQPKQEILKRLERVL